MCVCVCVCVCVCMCVCGCMVCTMMNTLNQEQSPPEVQHVLPYLSLEGRLFAPVCPGQPLIAVDSTVQGQRGDNVAPVEEARELMHMENDERDISSSEALYLSFPIP